MDYAKIIESYKEYSSKSGFDFVASDLQAIGSSAADKYDLISNALMYGFMIGHGRGSAEKLGGGEPKTAEPSTSNADRAEAATEIVWGVQDELLALEYIVGLFQNENAFDVIKAPDDLTQIRQAWRYIVLTVGHIRETLTQEADKLEKAFNLLNEIR